MIRMLKKYFRNVHGNREIDAIKCQRAMDILRDNYGLERSQSESSCVDKDGKPIPWYTYPAIEYLKQLDFSEKRVYEFGCGNSSLFWADRAKYVVSVEENENWYESRLLCKRENLVLKLRQSEDAYCGSILEEHGTFDVIIIDGTSWRNICCENGLKKLTPNGLIILDNSDRASEFEEYSDAIHILRQANLIQVDFLGFGPINNYTWGTSCFFSRSFDFTSKHRFQPMKGIGSLTEKG